MKRTHAQSVSERLCLTRINRLQFHHGLACRFQPHLTLGNGKSAADGRSAQTLIYTRKRETYKGEVCARADKQSYGHFPHLSSCSQHQDGIFDGSFSFAS